MQERGLSVLRFVSAVHRRLVFVRAAERMGACALGACAAGLVLTPILLWRGQAALGVALALLGAGVITGALWALVRRPTRLEAAVEADRQLRLHDLIGTALAILEDAHWGTPTDDPWKHSALAAAEARVRQVRPAEVMLARWGRRAWGTLGLATALLLTLTMLSANPGATQALDEPGQISRGSVEMVHPAENQSDQRIAPQMSGADKGGASDAPDVTSTAAGQTHAQPAPSAGASADATAAGGGAQSAQTPAATITAPTPGASGAAAGGAGETAGTAGTGAAGVGSTAGRLAPWENAGAWKISAGRAQEDLRSGRVSDEYRDLVGAYFQPQ